MIISLLVTGLYVIKLNMMGFERNGTSKYFVDIYKSIGAGMFSELMTYMIFWIMFFNFVYVV